MDVQQQRALRKLLSQLIHELPHLPVERGVDHLCVRMLHGFFLGAVWVHELPVCLHRDEVRLLARELLDAFRRRRRKLERARVLSGDELAALQLALGTNALGHTGNGQ